MWRNTEHSNIVIPLCVLLWFFAGKPCFSNGGDTLSKGESLTATQTLTSKDGIFELGFFETGTDSSKASYLGIWHKDFPEKTIVWVANRYKPLANTRVLEFKEVPNGNLGLYLGHDSFWSTNLKSSLPESIEAVLLDNGNLILRDGSKPDTIFWQSFDHPTHVWLPEAPLGFNRITGEVQSLISWRDEDDPSHGLFSMEISQDKDFELLLKWNMSRVYWKSGFWNGNMFALVPEISYFIIFSCVSNENHQTYCSYSVSNPKVFSMFVINPLGNFEQFTSLRSHHTWTSVHVMPKEERDVFGVCGPFGVLNGDTSDPCSCLHGFDPVSRRLKDGCNRKANLQCEHIGPAKGKKDGFLQISVSKLPAKGVAYSDHSHKSCMLACLEKCSCSAFAYTQSGCSIWEGDLYDSQYAFNNQEDHNLLYLKLALSELQNGKSKTLEVITAVVVPVVVLIFVGALGCFYTRRTKQTEKKESGEDLMSFDFNLSVNRPKRNNSDFDVPMFNYASVSAATNNFSPENKLGQGGFGPVYKGILRNGQQVALKRLSKKSGQGFEEFRNEILLIAKLQHRNLVRVLGCCVNTDESILIYEYMPNKSLDFFLFDSSKRVALDWKTRTYIIEGIAQGLLYLHEYSRVRIVHRDLKASNILLDDEMYPKISDFGMARMFGGNDSRAQTKKIVGTFGYMAPEYALEGLFSVKSDVYSFGVLVLEIISGKKNTGFYHTDSLDLLGHAWELWISNRGSELVDEKIATPPISRVLRYINVGLLCVQKYPNDRPKMSTVVSMLSSEIAALPPPKQPAFSTTTSVITNNDEGKHSVNGLTVSTIEPR